MKLTSLPSYEEYKLLEKLYESGTCTEPFRFLIYEKDKWHNEEYHFVATYMFVPMNVSLTIDVYKIEDSFNTKDYSVTETMTQIVSESQYKTLLYSVMCKLKNSFINERRRLDRLMESANQIIEVQI